MAANGMKELLTHELRDLLYAEQLILKMLGTLTREVKNPQVLARVQEHAGETEEQIQRLRRAFETLGEKPKAETCEAAVGLKAEHDSFKKEGPSKAMLEAFDLGNSLRVEHYEIAAYRSAIAVATAMGERDVAGLLGESLREEEAMASFVERNAVKALKALSLGMDLASGDAEVRLTGDGASRRKTAKSGSARSAGRGNGRTTASGTKGRSKSNGKAAASRSAGKSGGRSASGRTTAERSSGGKSSSRSGASKSGARSKSGGSSAKSRSSRSKSGGAGARA